MSARVGLSSGRMQKDRMQELRLLVTLWVTKAAVQVEECEGGSGRMAGTTTACIDADGGGGKLVRQRLALGVAEKSR